MHIPVFDIIEIGKRLIKVKESLPHGEWGIYLKEKVDFSPRSARRFIQVATEFGNRSAMTTLEPTKIFALLDIPSEERENFISQSHEVNGQTKTVDEMTSRELQKVIKEKKLKRKKQRKECYLEDTLRTMGRRVKKEKLEI